MQQTAYARQVYDKSLRKRDAIVGSRKAKTIVTIVKDVTRTIIAFLFTQVGICALLLVYNIAGAFAFRALEGVNGDPTLENRAGEAQNLTVRSLWNITQSLNLLDEPGWRSQTEATLLHYQHTITPIIAVRGYQGIMPIDTWTLPASLMYSLSIYTTIGYGNIVPRTDAGKIATIFYALFGMPLMLLYMSNIGDILAHCFKFIYFKTCRCDVDVDAEGYHKTTTTVRAGSTSGSGGKGTPQRTSTKSSKNSRASNYVPPIIIEQPNSDIHTSPIRIPTNTKDEIKESIPITSCLVVIAAYVLLGGVMFAHWENWSLLDGAYFCYASLSTIGFGDLVPGRLVAEAGDESGVETSQIVAVIYLLMGMALVAMCFSLIQEEALENIRAFWESLGLIRLRRKKKKEILLEMQGKNKPMDMDDWRQIEERWWDAERKKKEEEYGIGGKEKTESERTQSIISTRPVKKLSTVDENTLGERYGAVRKSIRAKRPVSQTYSENKPKSSSLNVKGDAQYEKRRANSLDSKRKDSDVVMGKEEEHKIPGKKDGQVKKDSFRATIQNTLMRDNRKSRKRKGEGVSEKDLVKKENT